MSVILQSTIPYDVQTRAGLPGVAPLDPSAWLIRDDAFAAQMALRDRLIAQRLTEVIAVSSGRTARTESDAASGALAPGLDPGACVDIAAALDELLETVLVHLACDSGYNITPRSVRRPDGVEVALRRDDPLWVLGRLVQEDLCVLQRPQDGAEHILTAAVLCFPAGWRLGQKIGRPLMRIHDPVPEYDAHQGKRVQRLFDGVQVGRPLWRFNALTYGDPALFQPAKASNTSGAASGLDRPALRDRQGGEPGGFAENAPSDGPRYLRSERQTILRLPKSRAVIFGIHTFVKRLS